MPDGAFCRGDVVVGLSRQDDLHVPCTVGNDAVAEIQLPLTADAKSELEFRMIVEHPDRLGLHVKRADPAEGPVPVGRRLFKPAGESVRLFRLCIHAFDLAFGIR